VTSLPLVLCRCSSATCLCNGRQGLCHAYVFPGFHELSSRVAFAWSLWNVTATAADTESAANRSLESQWPGFRVRSTDTGYSMGLWIVGITRLLGVFAHVRIENCGSFILGMIPIGCEVRSLSLRVVGPWER